MLLNSELVADSVELTHSCSVLSLSHISQWCDSAAHRLFTLSKLVSATYWTEVILKQLPYLVTQHTVCASDIDHFCLF